MSATDELRRLLDERGVEWLNSDGDCCDSDDDYMLAEQGSRKTTWSVDIAGDDMTITAHEVYENDELEPWFDLEFHEYFTLEQAIAATLGGGTCENVAPDYLDFLCSKCGFVHYHSDENDTGDGNDWSYCPRCGKAVER